jgi:hypothetical protein
MTFWAEMGPLAGSSPADVNVRMRVLEVFPIPVKANDLLAALPDFDVVPVGQSLNLPAS